MPARDRRRTGRRPAVVTSEVASLESLLKNPSPAAPPRVNVLQYLADDYVELRKAGQNRSPNVIAILNQIIAGYPQYPSIDEALYDLGLEYEVSGDLPNAHGAYLDLIRLHPTSRWVPAAHFALGELLLRAAKTDATKWVLALSEYDETLKDGNSALLPDALWRSGQAADQAGDPVRAAAFYVRLRHDYPDSAAAARIGEVP